MKVAYFLGGLNRGGAETLILDVCRQHEKVPFDLICMYRREGNMSDEFMASGAPMVQIPKTKGYLRYLWSIRRTLQREQVTIVHSQTPSNTLILTLALVGTGIEIITTFHGYNFAKAPWWQRKIVLVGSDKILFVSNHQKAYYEKKWNISQNDRWHVLYNGVDFSKIDSAKPSLKFAGQPQRIRLAMVGNFVSGRSQNIIAKSIHVLRERGITNFEFYFIGRRDDKETWRYDNCVKYCEGHQLDNVHFLGSRGDVPSLLKSIDGFVYSTEHDTFGIAVIEAIAARLPIMVNDWAVMQEVCELGLPPSNKAIRFFKTNDAKDCADKIAELLNNLQSDKDQLSVDCNYASEAARKKYSIEKHIKRLNEIYLLMNE